MLDVDEWVDDGDDVKAMSVGGTDTEDGTDGAETGDEPGWAGQEECTVTSRWRPCE